MSKPVELFKKYFANYFWLGMVVVLFSLIVDAYALQSNENARYIEVFVSLMETVGIAIMVASIFTFASGSSEFVDRIRLLLESIVVKRNFLGNIDNEGKKEALKSLVQPSDVEKNKYPNIGDYYGYFINKTLDIGGKSVRSNYQVSSRVFFDKEVEKIAVEGNYSYRVYPSKDGFHDIVVGFSEDMDGPSKCKHIAISNPDGNRKVHDGFKFMLHCDDDVIIQEKAIFVVGANYYVDLSDDRKDITITCNQWINEGSGLTVLVSIPHDIADKVIDTFGCGDNSSL